MAEQQNIRCRQKYMSSLHARTYETVSVHIFLAWIVSIDLARFFPLHSSSSSPRKIKVQISILFKKVWLRCTHCINMVEWLSIHIGSQRNLKCIDKHIPWSPMKGLDQSKVFFSKGIEFFLFTYVGKIFKVPTILKTKYMH